MINRSSIPQSAFETPPPRLALTCPYPLCFHSHTSPWCVSLHSTCTASFFSLLGIPSPSFLPSRPLPLASISASLNPKRPLQSKKNSAFLWPSISSMECPGHLICLFMEPTASCLLMDPLHSRVPWLFIWLLIRYLTRASPRSCLKEPSVPTWKTVVTEQPWSQEFNCIVKAMGGHRRI